MRNKESITIVRVAFPKNIRNSRLGIAHPEYGKESVMGSTTAKIYSNKGDSAFKAELGRLGYVTKADFEAKNFAPYGILDRDIPKPDATAELISKTTDMAIKNADLEKENEKLMAEIEALKSKKPRGKAAKAEPASAPEPEESGFVSTKGGENE